MSNKMDTTIKYALRALRAEAGAAGDTRQVELCALALEGDDEAMAECLRVMGEGELAAEHQAAADERIAE